MGMNLLSVVCRQRKYIDWKKAKLFGFRWNWDEEIKLRGIRLQSSSLPHLSPHLFMTDNNTPSVLGGGGQDFVDTIIAVKNVLERDER